MAQSAKIDSGRVDIVSLGEPLYELSRSRDGTTWASGFGGDTSVMAIAAARAGARAAYVSAVGDDAFGREFLELWTREGVDARGVAVRADAHTGVYFITYDAQGHHFSYLRAGSAASRMQPADLPLDLIASAKALHVSGISLAISTSACDATFAAMRAARAAGAKVQIDTNLRLRLWPLDRARAVIHAAVVVIAAAGVVIDAAMIDPRKQGARGPDRNCIRFLLALRAGAHFMVVGRRASPAGPGGRSL